MTKSKKIWHLTGWLFVFKRTKGGLAQVRETRWGNSEFIAPLHHFTLYQWAPDHQVSNPAPLALWCVTLPAGLRGTPIWVSYHCLAHFKYVNARSSIIKQTAEYVFQREASGLTFVNYNLQNKWLTLFIYNNEIRGDSVFMKRLGESMTHGGGAYLKLS